MTQGASQPPRDRVVASPAICANEAIAAAGWSVYLSKFTKWKIRPAMLRFLARFIGLWLLAAAVLALVVDGSKSIAASGIVTTTVGELLHAISPTSLEQAEAAVRDYVHPVFWDPIIVWVLLAPVFAVAGLLGALLLFLGQKPRAPLPELEAR